jgi:hypothetical protein
MPAITDPKEPQKPPEEPAPGGKPERPAKDDAHTFHPRRHAVVIHPGAPDVTHLDPGAVEIGPSRGTGV